MGEMDYLCVLQGLQEIPFGVGKKLLIEFLQGLDSNQSITKNRLYKKESFGILRGYEEEELSDMIESLILNGLIRTASIEGNKFWKVLELTKKGVQELKEPSLFKKRLAHGLTHCKTEITDEDRTNFEAHKDFLSKFNDEQKKAIINPSNHILCIAGEGSGKTTVLTKRIEFLVTHMGVSPRDILAITFTRKARQEMMSRLEGMENIMVETFNSFCEKVLLHNNSLVYDRQVRVLTYRDKIIAIGRALQKLDIDMARAIAIYFTQSQRKAKTNEQLAAIFLNDCFFVRDYFKFKHRQIEPFEDYENQEAAELVVAVVNYIDGFMSKNGLRDFADQLLDTIELFQKQKGLIPSFKHILVDEFQDVNSTQIKLLELLYPPNLFCVGDPRQSIFGWRGSDIGYILNFEEKYPDAEIITLTKNYRSTKHIVELINNSIKSMQLPDLESAGDGEKDIRLLRFETDEAESEFVIQTILASKIPREEIFVLARTNRQLTELSNAMNTREIAHIVRSDEINKKVVAGSGDVTLATIHAIKGMEARLVIVIGCTSQNFPCKGSEHPVVEMVKVDEYDKEEEERRLFYVAMSRAMESLYLSYSGKKPTYFITKDMLKIIEGPAAKTKFNLMKSNDILSRLKEWRSEKSKELGIPAYMILHDRTITDIAVKMPLTMTELEAVHGMGPTKVMKYGDEILGLVC
jgi:superfamily I DNA/RNA helicase